MNAHVGTRTTIATDRGASPLTGKKQKTHGSMDMYLDVTGVCSVGNSPPEA